MRSSRIPLVDPVPAEAAPDAQEARTRNEQGAGPAAELALRNACQVNPHVPVYLLGATQFPACAPESYGMGDESNALVYLEDAVDAWLETPGAGDWLADVVRRFGPARATGKPGRPQRTPGS